MKIWVPFIPLFISGDDAGNAQRQAEADRINSTTNRMVDTADVIRDFTKLLNDEGIAP